MHTARKQRICVNRGMGILCLIMLFCLTETDGHAQDWQPISTLVSTSLKIEYPVIKAFDDNIHLIWGDYRDNGKPQVYYKHSTDKGVSWNPGIRLSVDPNESYDHDMALWNTNVHVVWTDARHYSTDGSVEIYYKRSTNNGDSFEGEVRLTHTAEDNRYSDIAVFENTVHLIWVNYGIGVRVFYTRSEDNGNTWSIPLLLSDPTYDNSYPQIGAFGNNVFVVWHKWNASYTNNEICYRRSRDNGNNWDPEATLINGGGQYLFDPHISMFNDNIHITSGRETTDPQGYLYYIHSTNCGDDWSPETQLTFDDVSISYAPVAAFEERVLLVWSEDEDGDRTDEISYMKSLNNGVTWEPEFRLWFLSQPE